MITRVLSQRLVLLVIGLAAGSGILIPASYGSFHPVSSSEIQDGTIQSVDIGDGQVRDIDIATNAVRSAEIATDAVGAAELQGVTKLRFRSCTIPISLTANQIGAFFSCSFSGAAIGDKVFVMQESQNSGDACLRIDSAGVDIAGHVDIGINNECGFSRTGDRIFNIILFRT